MLKAYIAVGLITLRSAVRSDWGRRTNQGLTPFITRKTLVFIHVLHERRGYFLSSMNRLPRRSLPERRRACRGVACRSGDRSFSGMPAPLNACPMEFRVANLPQVGFHWGFEDMERSEFNRGAGKGFLPTFIVGIQKIFIYLWTSPCFSYTLMGDPSSKLLRFIAACAVLKPHRYCDCRV